MKISDSADLKSITIEGAFWNVFLAVANKFVTFAGQIAIAWFLLPSEMGIANLAIAMASFTAIFSVSGLGDVLLQRRKLKDESGQAFWLSLGFSFITACLIGGLALASPMICKPEIKSLLWVLAFCTLIGAPATIMGAQLKKKLDYKGLAFSQFIGGLVFTPLTVLLAWLGWGPLALIVPIIPRVVVMMLVMWIRKGFFEVTKPRWVEIVEIAKPTLSLSISSLLSGILPQVPVFVCGLVLGDTETGFFSWSWMVAGQVVFLLAMNLRTVLFPSFTHIGNDIERMTRVAILTAHAMTALLCVACGTQALLADFLIKILLPSKWYPAIPMVILFSLGLVTQGIWVSSTSWLNARGKYWQLLILSFSQLILNTAFTLVGSHYGGVISATIGCAIATFLGGGIYFGFIGMKISRAQISDWLIPTGFTFLLWTGCFLLSWRQSFVSEIIYTILFVVLDGWIWWRWDKGGLRSVRDKIRQIFTELRFNSKARV
jgi:O-antigen/teichoic acid export membrane protein